MAKKELVNPFLDLTLFLSNNFFFLLLGKTHRIRSKYLEKNTLCVSINDQLSLSSFISSLMSYDLEIDVDDCLSVYINISIHAPFDQLNRTFFSLFVCGSLTDSTSGLTFALRHTRRWKFIIEIPYSSKSGMEIDENLKYFFPVLSIIGQSSIEIVTDDDYQLYIGEEEELVARFLKAFFKGTIDRDPSRLYFGPLEFDALHDKEECRRYIYHCLETYVPGGRGNKIYEVSFTKFLYRRVQFFLNPLFTYNVINPNLGTTAMTQMIQEAKSLSKISFEDENYPRTYLVYDPGFALHLLHNNWDEVPIGLKNLWKNADPLLRAEFLNRNRFLKCLSWLVGETYEKCETIMNQMKFILTENFAYKLFHIHERKLTTLPLIIEGDTGIGKTYLLQFYSLLLNTKTQYDYDQTQFRKQILERISIWISETIFAKILEMEPSLLNQVLQRIKPKLMDPHQQNITDGDIDLDREYSDDDDDEKMKEFKVDEERLTSTKLPLHFSADIWYNEEQTNLLNEITTTDETDVQLSDQCAMPCDEEQISSVNTITTTDQTQTIDRINLEVLKQCKTSLRKGEYLPDMLLCIWQMVLFTAQKNSVSTTKRLLRTARQFIQSELTNLPLIDISSSLKNLLKESSLNIRTSVQILADYLSHSRVKPVFYRLLIHPGVTEQDLERFLSPITELARQWEDIKLVVFFDEVNTSSCLGLFKEIFTDRTLHGVNLPQNIFFTGAINPAMDPSNQENLVHRVDYLVHQLPQSLEHLKVRYGALDSKTLDSYITQKVAKFDLNFAIDTQQSAYLQKTLKKAILDAQGFCEEKLGKSFPF